MLDNLILTYYTTDIYDILIIQDPYGNVITIKIDEYEPERTKNAEYFWDDEILH